MLSNLPSTKIKWAIGGKKKGCICIKLISVDKTIILGELAKIMVALHVLTTVTSNLICVFTIKLSKSPLI